MMPNEEKIQQFHAIVGFDTCHRFEEKITTAILELAEDLQLNFINDEIKINYATHVFAKLLDDLSDFLEHSNVLN